jgi:hypothetical protein
MAREKPSIEAVNSERVAGRPGRSFQLCEHLRVIGGVDHDQHVLKVLGCRSDHARPPYIDFLDQRIEGDVRPGRRLDERVQIGDDEIDGGDAVLAEGRHVVGPPATSKDAAVNGGVERLHTAVHDLRKTGDLGDGGHFDPGGLERLGRAARGYQCVAPGLQGLGKRQKTSLIRNADECCRHGHEGQRVC